MLSSMLILTANPYKGYTTVNVQEINMIWSISHIESTCRRQQAKGKYTHVHRNQILKLPDKTLTSSKQTCPLLAPRTTTRLYGQRYLDSEVQSHQY